MNFSDSTELAELIEAAKQITVESNFAQRVIPLLDLTELSATANPDIITHLCRDAKTLLGNVAAVCIAPQFISNAKEILLGSPIKIAVVINFPNGTADVGTTLAAINEAITAGAHEIEVVMPYAAYLAGDKNGLIAFTRACKEACGTQIVLKVILETGALQQIEIIQAATLAVIDGGADFIKTSTGTVATGATLEAAAAILCTIKNSNREVGFKVAGGIRTTQHAASYLFLVEQILGSTWLSATKTRIGSSNLLKDIFAAPTNTH